MKLGNLTRVDLHEAWAGEATHFTPWLAQAENLALLGETLGIELECESQEKAVGPFKADILCKDTLTGSWVVIENQLEKTDHCHLGQLLTYAAGLKAVTIVWIAERFTEEHRAALDWLNQITEDQFNFFGLEIELWRIGESPLAPKFNVVCKPNDWSKTVKEMATRVEPDGLSETKQLQYEFWTEFVEYSRARKSILRAPSPQARYWMDFAIGRSEFCLAGRVSPQEEKIAALLAIKTHNAEACFQQLLTQKDEIESELGEPLEWRNRANKYRVLILRRDADVSDRSKWREQHEWLVNKLEKLHRVLAPRVKTLDIESDVTAE